MKTTMLSQLEKLMRRRYVTPLYALDKCGCLSLSQRAGEMARRGHTVLKTWVDLPNGKRVRAYKLG